MRRRSVSKENHLHTLKERARLYAHTPVEDSNEGNNIELVTFYLHQEYYGIEAKYTQEVYPVSDLTVLPSVPKWLSGVMNIRRKIVSIVDLNAFFGLQVAQEKPQYNTLIVGHEKNSFGLLTTSIEGICSINRTEMQSNLPTLPELTREFIKGITTNQLIILDAKKLLESDKLIINTSNQT